VKGLGEGGRGRERGDGGEKDFMPSVA